MMYYDVNLPGPEFCVESYLYTKSKQPKKP